MDTEHHYSASAARKTARQILDEIPAYRDMDGSTTEKSPNYWLGQLKQMLEILLEAGPATVAECDRVIKQALAARSRLLGETSEPVPPPKGECEQPHPGQDGLACTLPPGHKGGHKDERKDVCWPRYEDGSEGLDAALTGDSYRLPAGELAAEDAR